MLIFILNKRHLRNTQIYRTQIKPAEDFEVVNVSFSGKKTTFYLMTKSLYILDL